MKETALHLLTDGQVDSRFLPAVTRRYRAPGLKAGGSYTKKLSYPDTEVRGE